MMLDVAVLTCDKLLKPDPHNVYVSQAIYEDSLLLDYFSRHYIKAERVSWSDRSVNWSQVGCAMFRSTWDYLDKLDQFTAWLKRTSTQTRFANPYDSIAWNIDKRYLLTLESQGIPTVPTRILEPQSPFTMDALFTHFETDTLVIKPVYSVGGRDTYRISPSEAEAFAPTLRTLLSTRSMMVQPFQPAILDQGELSLVVIDGKFTHAVRKMAKEGEFRVQDNHGGVAIPYTASDAEKRFAEDVAAACAGRLHYARVDVVYNAEGKLSVMEVELFEPELFFRFDRNAAEALAHSIISQHDEA